MLLYEFIQPITETRRGLKTIGEMTAKVFWNPLRSDMKAMLDKSKIGDLRGGIIKTKDEILVAIWPARNLGHWNFFNECFMREGIESVEYYSFRITRDIETITEERFWRKSPVYKGDGFFCAFDCEPNYAPLIKLVGDIEPLSILKEASVPPTEYGYWIDPMGHIFPVGKHGHEAFVRDQGFSSAIAIRRGWIRITTYVAFQVEAMFSQVLAMGKNKMMQIARASDAGTYFVDSHDYDGGYESKVFKSYIEFQHGMDAIINQD